jgi:cell division protein FtsN
MNQRQQNNDTTACPSAWLWLLAGILIGAFGSFLIYLQVLSPPQQADVVEVETLLDDSNTNKTALVNEQAEINQLDTQTTTVEPARFEFYDMLPNDAVNQNNGINREIDNIPDESQIDGAATGYQYILQVAAFKELASATALQGKLVRAGERASILEGMKAGVLWYRVRIGPYARTAEAEQVKQRLLQQFQLHGILLRF